MKTRSVMVGEGSGAEEEESGWRREEVKGRRRKERRRRWWLWWCEGGGREGGGGVKVAISDTDSEIGIWKEGREVRRKREKFWIFCCVYLFLFFSFFFEFM